MLMVEILREKLKQIFTKTERALSLETLEGENSAWRQVVDDFLREVEAKPTDVASDIAHQFPAYLRLKKMPTAIIQTAHFEWIVYSREKWDFGSPKKESEILSLDLSVEVISITAGALNLQLSPGVYVIVHSQDQVQVRLLAENHLKMFEVLKEGDRKYRVNQLIEWMTAEFNESKSKKDWEMTLADLLQWGIVHHNT